MPSKFSTNLRAELIGAGEQSSIWGITTNKNLSQVFEEAITKVSRINISGGGRVLSALSATSDETRANTLLFNGSHPSGNVTFFLPEADAIYFVINRSNSIVRLGFNTGEYFEGPPNSISRAIFTTSAGCKYCYSITFDMLPLLASESFSNFISSANAAPIQSPIFTGVPKAPTPPDDSDDETIATTEFVLNAGVPEKVIIMWDEPVSTIPFGWHICDGTNGTPDLRDLFIANTGGGFSLHSSGGYEDATLVEHNHGGATGTQNRNHSHTLLTDVNGNHTHPDIMTSAYRAFDGDNETRVGRAGSTNAAGAHTHSYTTGNASADHTHSTSAQGGSGVGRNIPPYYSVYYIMRI